MTTAAVVPRATIDAAIQMTGGTPMSVARTMPVRTPRPM